MSVPNRDRRKAIVYRKDGCTTTVQASAIKDAEELAWAIGFLAHHRLYKMSKGGGVSAENASEVAMAFMAAAEAFQAEVMDPLMGSNKTEQISELGAGEVKNPFWFV